MLLDEITSALDPELVSEVLNIVRDLAQPGHDHAARHPRDGLCPRGRIEGLLPAMTGVVHEEGPPEQIFGDPKDERTRGVPEADYRGGEVVKSHLPPLRRWARGRVSREA